MRTTQFTLKKGRITVHSVLFRIGKDGVILLFGGDEPHIGACAVGSECGVYDLYCLPGHREDEIIHELATELQKNKILRNFILSCGIHVNNITKTEIKDVLQLCRRLFAKTAGFLGRDEHMPL
jgi:hypothetical protein